MKSQVIEMTVENFDANEAVNAKAGIQAMKELSEMELLLVGGGSGDVGFA